MFTEGEINKRGQVTMFVILAIVIVVGGVLVYQFAPGVKTNIVKTDSPNRYMQDCLENDLVLSIEDISLNGGFISPKNFYKKDGVNIGYLCYTSEYNNYCTKTIPFLKEHIEKELLDNMKSKIDSCFNSLNEDFTKNGYTVKISRGRDSVKILSTDTEIISDTRVELIKGDSKVNTEKIRVVYNNNLYQLLSIARDIIERESVLGSADMINYVYSFRGIKTIKLKQTGGTTIYKLTDKKTGDFFQFASRSLVFSSGLIPPETIQNE